MKIDSWVFCSFDFEGTHCWPEAIHQKDIGFLALSHRHMFHVKLYLPVSHHDRDVEFIKLKRYIKCITDDWPTNLHDASCESIAYKLAVASQCFLNGLSKERMYFMFPNVRTAWDKRFTEVDLEFMSKVRVEVSEDGENGAHLEIDFRS
jgi:hypothetical protein